MAKELETVEAVVPCVVVEIMSWRGQGAKAEEGWVFVNSQR